jgi:hypothetical protein
MERLKKLEKEREVLLEVAKSQEEIMKNCSSEEERINELEEELKYQNRIIQDLNTMIENLQSQVTEKSKIGIPKSDKGGHTNCHKIINEV